MAARQDCGLIVTMESAVRLSKFTAERAYGSG